MLKPNYIYYTKKGRFTATWELQIPKRLLHREDGPAMISRKHSTLYWYLNGKKHREGAAAVVTYRNNVAIYGERWRYGKWDGKNDYYYTQAERDTASEWLKYFEYEVPVPAVVTPAPVVPITTIGRVAAPIGAVASTPKSSGKLEGYVYYTRGGRHVEEDSKKIPYGTLHREDGPALISRRNKKLYWYRDGKKHNDDGPAIVIFNKVTFEPQSGEYWHNGEATGNVTRFTNKHDHDLASTLKRFFEMEGVPLITNVRSPGKSSKSKKHVKGDPEKLFEKLMAI